MQYIIYTILSNLTATEAFAVFAFAGAAVTCVLIALKNRIYPHKCEVELFPVNIICAKKKRRFDNADR